MSTPTHATPSPRLPSLDPSPDNPGRALRVFLYVFDDDAGRELGLTCAVGAETSVSDGAIVCGFLTDPTSPIDLDPTLPLADALWTLLTAKYAQEDQS